MKTRSGVIVAALMASGGVVAAAEPAPVDAEFLEFLGSLDTEDEAWREYLAERPERVAGKAAAGKPARRPEETRPPPARGKSTEDDVKKKP